MKTLNKIRRKSILALTLAFITLASLLPVPAAAAGASDSVDLIISTEAELRDFAASVNSGTTYEGQQVALANDISLTSSWMPIGNYTHPFKGSFDGRGHNVMEMEIMDNFEDILTCQSIMNNGKYDFEANIGLFGATGDSAEIKNLSVSGEIISPNTDIMDWTRTIMTARLGEDKLCSNLSREYNCGGIVGIMYGHGGRVTNCTSNVNISTIGFSDVGGIAGLLSETIVDGCVNNGQINIGFTSKTRTGSVVGGICGSLSGESITNCANYGSITADTFTGTVSDSRYPDVIVEYDPSTSTLGGLVGDIGNRMTLGENGLPVYHSSSISNSFNKGDIFGKAFAASGLIGENCSESVCEMSNCYNTGNITMTKRMGIMAHDGRCQVGGLCGFGVGRSGGLNAVNCFTTGNVIFTNPSEGRYTYCELTKSEFMGSVWENNFGPSEKDRVTAEQMGSAYKTDVNGVNGGLPLLAWESGEASDETYVVTFSANPADTAVSVYSDSALANRIEPSESGYVLKSGTYYYKAERDGYLTEKGSFNVLKSGKTINVTLKESADVTFSVEPADADFVLTDSQGGVQTPVSANGGAYGFTLRKGGAYTYTVAANGYASVKGMVIATVGDHVSVALSASEYGADESGFIYGSGNEGKTSVITAGGTYYLAEEATGTLTISTTEPVTLLGNGNANAVSLLSIDCSGQVTDLTLKDVFISNNGQAFTYNLINFAGIGNKLRFEGRNVIEQNTNATGKALIHVGTGSSITVSGGIAYIYKYEQGSGIGGNMAENNGDITFDDATLFIKGSKQGAVIGSGASASSASTEPGSITFRNSTINLIAVARGAGIGGSAGGKASKGADVYVENSSINVNVDFSGAGIGGGGFDPATNVSDGAANDSFGGVLHYTSGSIRVYIDENARNAWKVDAPGVNNNLALTASVVDANGEPLYLLTADTSGIAGDTLEVKERDQVIYSGGRHEYLFVNESLQKGAQTAISMTVSNWAKGADNNLYLYLSGRNHHLTINGADYTANWDDTAKRFTLTKGWAGIGDSKGDVNGDGKVNVKDAVLIKRYLAGQVVTIDLEMADYDGNGVIQSRDSAKIMKMISELDLQ